MRAALPIEEIIMPSAETYTTDLNVLKWTVDIDGDSDMNMMRGVGTNTVCGTALETSAGSGSTLDLPTEVMRLRPRR